MALQVGLLNRCSRQVSHRAYPLSGSPRLRYPIDPLIIRCPAWARKLETSAGPVD